ncbi:MAG: hypothetical protein P4L10_12715 [Acidobacteriaceae bacterium]|nr:hypothetical protein [Acidobacteriaceae bacterium]
MEFESADSIEKALKLNDSLFNKRKISVERKRKNTPGMSRRRGYGNFGRMGRGRGFPPFARGGYRYAPF